MPVSFAVYKLMDIACVSFYLLQLNVNHYLVYSRFQEKKTDKQTNIQKKKNIRVVFKSCSLLPRAVDLDLVAKDLRLDMDSSVRLRLISICSGLPVVCWLLQRLFSCSNLSADTSSM